MRKDLYGFPASCKFLHSNKRPDANPVRWCSSPCSSRGGQRRCRSTERGVPAHSLPVAVVTGLQILHFILQEPSSVYECTACVSSRRGLILIPSKALSSNRTPFLKRRSSNSCTVSNEKICTVCSLFVYSSTATNLQTTTQCFVARLRAQVVEVKCVAGRRREGFPHAFSL